MNEPLVFWVGNRQPSYEDTLTIDGAPVNLTGKTVAFRVREVGKTTLIVDQPISNVPDTTGVVRYDWAAGDIASNGLLTVEREALAWFRTTDGLGRTQDLGETVIYVRAHAPLNAYVELEPFKLTTEVGKGFADRDIQKALVAASRGIDKAMSRRFSLDADATQERRYSLRRRCGYFPIDDLVALTDLKFDLDGDGTFEITATEHQDFELEPLNAASDVRPWETVRFTPASGIPLWTQPWPAMAKVKGQFGWTAVPEAIVELTTIIAARLLKRTREAPFGIIAFGLDGAIIRATSYATDPDFNFLTKGYRRGSVLA